MRYVITRPGRPTAAESGNDSNLTMHVGEMDFPLMRSSAIRGYRGDMVTPKTFWMV